MLAKEVLITLGAFFGTAIAVVVPFVILYADRMPRAADGSALGARRAMMEDPVVFVVLAGGTLLAATVTNVVFRRMRPRLVRAETAEDVTQAAQAATRALRQHGADVALAHQTASSYLLDLPKRRWPYEANRIWVTVHGDRLEVVAERTYPRAKGAPGFSSAPVARMEVQGRAQVRADGAVLSQSAQVYQPPTELRGRS